MLLTGARAARRGYDGSTAILPCQNYLPRKVYPLRSLACLALAAFALSFAAQKPAPKLTYIRAGHLFDSATGKYQDNVTLVVSNDRIQSVESPGFHVPAGAQVVDLSKDYVLPGLIDCHTHLSARADRYAEINLFTDTPFDSAIAGVVNANTTLNAGFTTVRDVGSLPFLAVDLRNNIDAGFIPGPRIVASGPAISITGGHGDLNDFAPQVTYTMFPQKRDFGIADGPDEIRKTVREQMKYGVDVIKILASGGVLSKGDQPGAPQFTYEELKVAADTAHQGGRKIAAHAHGTQSIKDAIRAGIDSIEHASLADDEGIALAKEHGTYFVMDIYNDDYILQVGPKVGMTEELLNKERGVGKLQRATFRKAHAAGVKMAFGTDAGVYPHGDNAKQFHTMVEYGMTPAEAIQAATFNAADLIGRSKDVGQLTPGHYADLVATAVDPLQHVETLEHVDVVMKGGSIVRGAMITSAP
jgi:imidazolonepropionase-like amidohydrolase